jgi:linoleoyl-CoA desaturase
MQKVKFQNKQQAAFFSTLRSKVEDYFEENNLSKCGGNKIMIKAIFMLSLYFIPYVTILTAGLSPAVNLILVIVMGFGVAGVGMSVMHDAIHGSFSDNNLFNKIFGGSLYALGGNVYNWEIQHNKLHHTYTNIHEVDEDITGKFLLRLSFQDKKKAIHRFQHIYAFFLYSLMTLSFLWKDFKEIRLFNEMSKTGVVKPFPKKEIFKLLITKSIYIVFIFVIPYFVMDITFGQWFLGFMIMHCTAGLILSTIFQLAHVVEGAHQPLPDDQGTIENAWAVHQLQTTSNFSGSGSWFSWMVGGLDYQIEHHLFPTISHVYYKDLSPIVAETAREFGLEYNSKGNFNNALISHVRMLKNLGRNESY